MRTLSLCFAAAFSVLSMTAAACSRPADWVPEKYVPPTVTEQIDTADFVAEGVVTKIVWDKQEPRFTVSFRVGKVLKGDAPRKLTFTSWLPPPDPCGSMVGYFYGMFDENAHLRVYLKRSESGSKYKYYPVGADMLE